MNTNHLFHEDNKIISIECIYCPHNTIQYIDVYTHFIFSFNFKTNLQFVEHGFLTTQDSYVLLVKCKQNITNNRFDESFELDNQLFVYLNTRTNRPPFDGKLYKSFLCTSVNDTQIELFISDTLIHVHNESNINLNGILFPLLVMLPLLSTRTLVYKFEQDFPSKARETDFTTIIHYSSSMNGHVSIFDSPLILLPNTSMLETYFTVIYDSKKNILRVTNDSNEIEYSLINSITSSHQVVISVSRNHVSDKFVVHNVILFQGHPVNSLDLSNIGSKNNVYIGTKSGYYNRSGKNNIHIGQDTGGTCTDGHHNIFIGSNTGTLNNTSTNSHNICIGDDVKTSGNTNICLGNKIITNTNSNHNILIANNQNIQGDHNIIIGNTLHTQTNHTLSIHDLITGNFDSKNVSIHGNIDAYTFRIGIFEFYTENDNLHLRNNNSNQSIKLM